MPRLLDLAKDKKVKELEKPKKIEITKEPRTQEIKKPLMTPKKIDFNGIPGEVVHYRVNSEHSPTIIKIMNAYEDIAGVSAKRDKKGQSSKTNILKSLIYVSIHKLHQIEKGEIR